MIALISDVHANLQALERALEAIFVSGAERILCAGDLVGYGSQPDAVVARLAAAGIACVRGNHDRWALRPGGQSAVLFGYDRLADETRAFLRDLPQTLRLEEGAQRVVLVHGAPDSDMTFINPEEQDARELAGFLEIAAADILICGHTHRPMHIQIPGRGRIINPGALLGPEQVIEGGRARSSLDGTFGLLQVEPFSFQVRRVADGSPVDLDVHRVFV